MLFSDLAIVTISLEQLQEWEVAVKTLSDTHSSSRAGSTTLEMTKRRKRNKELVSETRGVRQLSLDEELMRCDERNGGSEEHPQVTHTIAESKC
jgi:hypothetical protein